MTEATMVHEIAITVRDNYASVLRQLADAVAGLPPGTKLLLRYEHQVQLSEPLSTAANRLSASVTPTPNGKGPLRKGHPMRQESPAKTIRTSIRVVPAPQPKRESPIPERPPDSYEPAFSRTPLRERMKARRAAEALT